tara:strand:+ start:24261 stop:25385 length:1125 start_codon:yes stop_codon:yes gene_type:complete
MLQNKIYQNFIIEITKTFLVIVFGLSIIALTVRAVNFLDLIVDNGYPVLTYFQYSFLNLFGIAPKFIPLAFLLSLLIFILKHLDDSEFVILWTSGVKKIQIVNLFLFISLFIIIFYIFFSAVLTPLALNKSRQLLSKDQLNSFLPTVRSQQFTDSFKGFTFIVKKKLNNEIEHIFLYDNGNNLKNLSSNISDSKSTTIVAEEGLIESRKMFLFNGQIISTKKDKSESEIIKFEQLNIDLSDLVTTTIKKPKLQETSTLTLLSCFVSKQPDVSLCKEDAKKEIVPILIRRVVMPFYIPVITLLCSFLLFRNKKLYFNKASVFCYAFSLLLFTELIIRYTGLNDLLGWIYLILPFSLIAIFYFFLNSKFSSEAKLQ